MRPSVAAWAVNQLARERRADVRRLLDAADELRKVQTGGRGDFAGAARAERDAVQALVDGAADILRRAGRAPTDATLSRVAQTLQAAAAGDAARAELERGTLTRELEPAGFGGLLGAIAERPPERRQAAPETPPRPSRAAKEALARTRARARELRAASAAAERKARDAQRALERAERDAAKARERADEAQAEVERRERDARRR